MEFEFAKYTEVTDYAFSVNPDYSRKGYARFFVCPDVWDFWFVRVLKGFWYEDGAGYVKDAESYILERNKVRMDKKGETLTLSKLKKIIEEDSDGNWDLQQGYDIEELVDRLDQGFGIINRSIVSTQ